MTIAYQSPWATLYQGHVIECLRALPAESIHCCVTSPPYWGLRAYGTDPQVWGDGWRGELGSEPTVESFVSHLVEVFREVKRVLRKDGVCWVNLGDAFAGGAGGRGDAGRQFHTDGSGGPASQKHDGQRIPRGLSGLKTKDLLGVPWTVAFALRADGWFLRRDVIWSKPNPLPESVTDRPGTAHEYLFMLTRSARYFYDAEAVREPATYGRREWGDRERHDAGQEGRRIHEATRGADPAAGRNLRSVWTIPTPYARLRDDLTPEQRAYVVGELLRRGLI